MKTILISALFLGITVISFSQKITLSGYVSNKETGEKLIDVNIYDKIYNNSTTTNNYGYFSINIEKEDSTTLVFFAIGYSTYEEELYLTEDKEINIKLDEDIKIQEVVIFSAKSLIQQTEISTISIPISQIKLLPSLGGEADILKAIQLMPGVQSGNEGSNGLYVRGGSPDQNLILLDDVPLYYVNHLAGFVSTFNADAIKSIKLTKGGFPAHYGSRLSSVLDIRMKDGNSNEFHGQGTIGIISSKISLEGPINNKSSYIISFRRFLYDLFSRPFSMLTLDGASIGYNFYDFNAKLNYQLTSKNKLFLSLYFGDDKIIISGKDNLIEETDKYKFSTKWGNKLVAFRWNHNYTPKLYSNLISSYTYYKYSNLVFYSTKTPDEYTEEEAEFYTGINDINLKYNVEFKPNNNYILNFGIDNIFHFFKPGVNKYKLVSYNNIETDTIIGDIPLLGIENSIYFENIFNITNFFSANIGLRISNYLIKNKPFLSFEPRILVNFNLAKKISIKASYAKMQQNIHLLTSAGAGMPKDMWMPATVKAPPSSSEQYSTGLFFLFPLLNFSVETYYKKSTNLIAYKQGISFYNNSQNWEQKIETNGEGESYGLEFLIQKNIGKISGWVGYTFSKTNRQFLNINNGKTFPYKYDRTHDLSVVFLWQINDNIDFSTTWVYGTGNAITLGIGKYNTINDYREGSFQEVDYNQEIIIYEDINSTRMRDYHRLDIGLNFNKSTKWGERTVNLSIYNIYNRQNPYYYYYTTEYQRDKNGNIIVGTEETKLYQQSFFPIIPSISYSFKF
ncbi:MAG: TonB-dependent receptor [Bacteroidales bacterium]|nr:TonB-dependent receptor [Bacteroidales bacterium]